MNLSILVVNWNAEKLIATCLASIQDAVKNISHEIFVVDNASSDNSIRLIEHNFPQVKLIKNRQNLGFAKANNQAIKQCQGQYILLLNPDTLALPGTIDCMLNYIATNSKVGVVGSKLIDKQGKTQWSCHHFPSLLTEFYEIAFLSKLLPRNPITGKYLLSYWDHSSTRDVDWVSGACLMTKREIFDKIGLLDENFFMYTEDVDFCCRVKSAGYRVVYLPEAQVVHCQGESSRQRYTDMFTERYRSRYIFFKKHYGRTQMNVLRFIIIFSFVLRFIVAAFLALVGKNKHVYINKIHNYLKVIKISFCAHNLITSCQHLHDE